MSSRLLDTTKYIWCLLALYAGLSWSPVNCVTAKTPPKNPSTIEAQAKFFQDFFSVQLSPYKIEFGHVCEDPNTWEQRYEKKDYKNHRDMGKVRWGDKKGGYGEHYWDLNHAGHAGNHDNHGYNDHDDHSDDGSYHHDDTGDSPNDGFDSNDHIPNYGNDDYDPEKASYEENGRAKRAHPRVKVYRKPQTDDDGVEASTSPPKYAKRKQKEQLQEAPSQKVDKYSDEEEDDDSEELYRKVKRPDDESGEVFKKVKRPRDDSEEVYQKVKRPHDDSEEVYKKVKRPHQRQTYEEQEENPKPKQAKNQLVLVVKENEKPQEPQQQQQPNTQNYNQYVPYEGGSGVRQHHQPEVAAAASVPRLFLEPSTGHVVDRATGQAYVLQPIAPAINYN